MQTCTTVHVIHRVKHSNIKKTPVRRFPMSSCKRQLEILSNSIHRYLIALCPGIAGDIFNGNLGIR